MQGLEGQIPTRVQDDGHLIKAPVARRRADDRAGLPGRLDQADSEH